MQVSRRFFCITPVILTFLIYSTILLSTQTAAFTDLENFVRVLGSLNPNTSSVTYVNGSAFLKQAGKDMCKIFNYEGYNINRLLRQPDGSFLTLSRSFIVYRDPITSEILQVWMNPVNNKPNEVFYVTNDPADAKFSTSPPTMFLPERGTTDYTLYNFDFFMEYPNPLSPDKYPAYSAGPFFDDVELSGFFVNHTLINSSQDDSLPMVQTWMAKTPFLPWMELGAMDGSLYYSLVSWKCISDGLSCVADDIMEIVNRDYPKFKDAPTTEEKPNEDEWTNFKRVIDQRRQAGLPDIMIPTVNISTDTRPMTYTVDDRVVNIFYDWPLYVNINGTAWSEIPGNQSLALFGLRGDIGIDFEPLPDNNGYRFQFDGTVMYIDLKTGASLRKFKNPFTGKVNNVSAESELGVDFVFSTNSLYTIDIPQSEVVALIGAQSVEGDGRNSPYRDAKERWTVNILNFIFPYRELAKKPMSASFYGTYAMFQSWPDWMEMGNIPGNIVYKVALTNHFI